MEARAFFRGTPLLLGARHFTAIELIRVRELASSRDEEGVVRLTSNDSGGALRTDFETQLAFW